MLTTLIAMTACQVGPPPPAQTSGSPAYNPYNATAVSIALTGVNVLRAGEAEGDEPYILAYEYGVQIPVIKGVLQKPKPLPLRLVGKGSFDGIRSGYDWAKPNKLVTMRGFSTNFARQTDAWVLFGLAVFVFDHDEFNEAQLARLKLLATSKVTQALERTLQTDPKVLVDSSSSSGAMLVQNFDSETMKKIKEMFTNKADNVVGCKSIVLLSKPVGPQRGVPNDVTSPFLSSGLAPNSTSPLTLNFKNPGGFFDSEAKYLGDLRILGHMIRHR